MARNPNTTTSGGSFNDATVEAVWQKGTSVPGYLNYRTDKCKALIQRNQYGDTSSKYGWEIDHIKPVSKGGTDDLGNLQPLQWENNRHKGDDWPSFTCKVTI